MVNYKDYYAILGVNKTASLDEIKKAFRKLARQYHPDVNPGDPSAEDRFKEINEAHEVLSDTEKRAKYDKFGSEWETYARTGGNPDHFDWSKWNTGANSGYQQVSPEEFEEMFGSTGFSDFFENLFGRQQGHQSSNAGFSSFGFGSRSQPARGQDIEYTAEITLQEAFYGTSRKLTYEDGCVIEARIPRGVKTGSRVRLAGQGSAGMLGGKAGDLYLVIEVQPDHKFEREGDDLKTTVSVDLYTALLGGTVKVSSIDKTVDLTIPEVTQNGKVFRLKGLGMPNIRNPEERGALYAKVEVRLPQSLTAEEKELISQLRDQTRVKA